MLTLLVVCVLCLKGSRKPPVIADWHLWALLTTESVYSSAVAEVSKSPDVVRCVVRHCLFGWSVGEVVSATFCSAIGHFNSG
jgi:hypothetical protein